MPGAGSRPRYRCLPRRRKQFSRREIRGRKEERDDAHHEGADDTMVTWHPAAPGRGPTAAQSRRFRSMVCWPRGWESAARSSSWVRRARVPARPICVNFRGSGGPERPSLLLDDLVALLACADDRHRRRSVSESPRGAGGSRSCDWSSHPHPALRLALRVPSGQRSARGRAADPGCGWARRSRPSLRCSAGDPTGQRFERGLASRSGHGSRNRPPHLAGAAARVLARETRPVPRARPSRDDAPSTEAL